MAIIFANKRVLSFLLKHGFVYTLRNRKKPTEENPISIETLKTARTQKGIGKVMIIFIRMINTPDDLKRKEISASGFNSRQEWVEEYMRLNNFNQFKPAKLLYVELLEYW